MKDRFDKAGLGVTDARNKQRARFTSNWHSTKRIAYLKQYKDFGGIMSPGDYKFLMRSISGRRL